MRKVALVVFDIENKIIDRFNLDYITDIKGVGFKLKISSIEGDIEDVLTKVVQEKQEVKFKIHFVNYAYEKSAILGQWLEKYSIANSKLALEYGDGIITRYIEGKITELSKEEKDEYGRLIREATFKPLTPFFSNIENTIKIKVAAVGKSYPYTYPYSYGLNIVENDEINNTYILDVPITVKITGSITHPTILLLDEDGQEYNRVQFSEVTLSEGQYLIVNSADRKIYFFNGDELEDYTAEPDANFDTFLRAKRGKSTISINFEITDTGELTGSWRQYGL